MLCQLRNTLFNIYQKGRRVVKKALYGDGKSVFYITKDTTTSVKQNTYNQ
jgi:hypothetical protein